MKRSELIKQMFLDFDEKYTENTIHEILFKAECYGMLPPKTCIKIPDEIYEGNLSFPGKIVDGYELPVNEWDQE